MHCASKSQDMPRGAQKKTVNALFLMVHLPPPHTTFIWLPHPPVGPHCPPRGFQKARRVPCSARGREL